MDREKVIKDLEECLSASCRGFRTWKICPYNDDEWNIMRDALALLREQETEWEHLWDAPDGTFKGRCKKCGFVHFFIEGHDEQYKFCPECGRAVKW